MNFSAKSGMQNNFCLMIPLFFFWLIKSKHKQCLWSFFFFKKTGNLNRLALKSKVRMGKWQHTCIHPPDSGTASSTTTECNVEKWPSCVHQAWNPRSKCVFFPGSWMPRRVQQGQLFLLFSLPASSTLESTSWFSIKNSIPSSQLKTPMNLYL